MPRSTIVSSSEPTTKMASWRSETRASFTVKHVGNVSSIVVYWRTSILLCEVGATDEAEVAGARVRRPRVARLQLRLEVVLVRLRLLAVNAEVTVCVVRARHPDLREKGVNSDHVGSL